MGVKMYFFQGVWSGLQGEPKNVMLRTTMNLRTLPSRSSQALVPSHLQRWAWTCPVGKVGEGSSFLETQQKCGLWGLAAGEQRLVFRETGAENEELGQALGLSPVGGKAADV